MEGNIKKLASIEGSLVRVCQIQANGVFAYVIECESEADALKIKNEREMADMYTKINGKTVVYGNNESINDLKQLERRLFNKSRLSSYSDFLYKYSGINLHIEAKTFHRYGNLGIMVVIKIVYLKRAVAEIDINRFILGVIVVGVIGYNGESLTILYTAKGVYAFIG